MKLTKTAGGTLLGPLLMKFLGQIGFNSTILSRSAGAVELLAPGTSIDVERDGPRAKERGK